VKLLQEYVINKYRQSHIDPSKIGKEKVVASTISSALKHAYDHYFKVSSSENGLIAFINEAEVQVVSDIRILVDTLGGMGIQTISLTFEDINFRVSYDEETGVLILNETGQEIAVAYLRTGYMPANYPGNSIQGRVILEKSAAIKCPSIDLQLCTIKKVEEALASDSIWAETFGDDLSEIKPIFKGMWGFENIEAVRDVIDDCKANPQNYVLKTQREGGGNNYFGSAILPFLEDEAELWQYSLMKRVFPQSFQATLVKGGDTWTGEAISELGIFGEILCDKDGTVLVNEEIGCMMRTKPVSNDEGGVCAGYAYVDTPYRFTGSDEEFRQGNLMK
jgi:glutathione synthetase